MSVVSLYLNSFVINSKHPVLFENNKIKTVSVAENPLLRGDVFENCYCIARPLLHELGFDFNGSQYL